MSKTSNWTNGVVAIIGRNHHPVGAGFLVSDEGLVVTCAHVLSDAGWHFGNWDAPVELRFYATGRSGVARVEERCYVSEINGDIAFLKLDEALPAAVEPLRLAPSRGAEGHVTQFLGYPTGRDGGLRGDGEVVGLIPGTVKDQMELQLRSTEVTKGYSGGPVWDRNWNRVIGMILSGRDADRMGRLGYTAFAAPAETLAETCDGLELSQPDESQMVGLPPASPELQFNFARIYQQASPRKIGTEEIEQASMRLAELPLDFVPGIANLPSGSRMPFGHNNSFVGRKDELKDLASALKDGRTSVVTGIGGVGKTQLATEFVHRYGQYFPGGVYWLSFADPTAIPSEIAACAEAGGLMLHDGYERSLDASRKVRLVSEAWQSSLPRLLVYDNCEDETLLRQWHPPAGASRVLITGRRGQWARDLEIYNLALGVLERQDSISLLRKDRPAERADDAILDNIANELGDLPLALHLADGFLTEYQQVVNPDKYLEQLRDMPLMEHWSLEGRGSRHSPTGHDLNLARTFALSYDRLDAANPVDSLAQATLARAAFFAPGEPILRELLRQTLDIAGDDFERLLQAEDVFNRLVRLGLLEEGVDGTLRQHRLVVQFVKEVMDLEQLDRANWAVEQAFIYLAERDAIDDRHRAFWLTHFRYVADQAYIRGSEVAGHLSSLLVTSLNVEFAVEVQLLNADGELTGVAINDEGWQIRVAWDVPQLEHKGLSGTWEVQVFMESDTSDHVLGDEPLVLPVVPGLDPASYSAIVAGSLPQGNYSVFAAVLNKTVDGGYSRAVGSGQPEARLLVRDRRTRFFIPEASQVPVRVAVLGEDGSSSNFFFAAEDSIVIDVGWDISRLLRPIRGYWKVTAHFEGVGPVSDYHQSCSEPVGTTHQATSYTTQILIGPGTLKADNGGSVYFLNVNLEHFGEDNLPTNIAGFADTILLQLLP